MAAINDVLKVNTQNAAPLNANAPSQGVDHLHGPRGWASKAIPKNAASSLQRSRLEPCRRLLEARRLESAALPVDSGYAAA